MSLRERQSKFTYIVVFPLLIAAVSFNVPSEIILTGKLLKKMPTVTSYLEYRWYEAHCGGEETAFIVLMDKEHGEAVIGFYHVEIWTPEGDDFISVGKYFTWLSSGDIVRLANVGMAREYVEKYKQQRRQNE
jgi:hypothetical protein